MLRNSLTACVVVGLACALATTLAAAEDSQVIRKHCWQVPQGGEGRHHHSLAQFNPEDGLLELVFDGDNGVVLDSYDVCVEVKLRAQNDALIAVFTTRKIHFPSAPIFGEPIAKHKTFTYTLPARDRSRVAKIEITHVRLGGDSTDARIIQELKKHYDKLDIIIDFLKTL